MITIMINEYRYDHYSDHLNLSVCKFPPKWDSRIRQLFILK